MTKILIINSEIAICEMLHEFFGKKGYKVMYAVNGEGGLDIFSLEKPHIVILDLNLKHMSGLEVLKKIKSMEPSCLVIIIAASDLEADKEEALESGADFYMSKPFSILKLDKLVSGL